MSARPSNGSRTSSAKTAAGARTARPTGKSGAARPRPARPRRPPGRFSVYTGIGFPRVFYLRYDGYSAYFPLWALARYRNLITGNARRVGLGM
jgi:squalene-hopene/tetraprenyl-beta-curcumene cyclase